MKTSWNVIRAAFVTLGGWLGWFLGGMDTLLYALIAFVAVDYLTGVMCAIIEKKLSSNIGARGIFKKILIFILVGIAHTLDSLITESGSVIRSAVIFFFISNEGISLLENASVLGLPIPKKLKDVLAQFQNEDRISEKNNTGGENNGNK